VGDQDGSPLAIKAQSQKLSLLPTTKPHKITGAHSLLSALDSVQCIGAICCGIASRGGRVERVLAKEILAWPAAGTGCDLSALISHLTRQFNEPLTEPQVRSALSWLSARGLVRVDGDAIRLIEPDKPECQLYPSLERRFAGRAFLRTLGVQPGTYVFQDTSRGGRAGHGPLTKPDFTLVAVKAGRFERPLEVMTFEVKNRSGADVASVYEVVAHGRVSHYPFLACPRSRLEPAKIESIRRASENEGIGLILFDIVFREDGSFTTDRVAVDLKPRRRAPDMTELQRHLEGRLSAESCAKLEELARGA